MLFESTSLRWNIVPYMLQWPVSSSPWFASSLLLVSMNWRPPRNIPPVQPPTNKNHNHNINFSSSRLKVYPAIFVSPPPLNWSSGRLPVLFWYHPPNLQQEKTSNKQQHFLWTENSYFLTFLNTHQPPISYSSCQCLSVPWQKLKHKCFTIIWCLFQFNLWVWKRLIVISCLYQSLWQITESLQRFIVSLMVPNKICH